jgi:hypothetical protein
MSEIENAFQDLCLDEPDPNEHHEAELTLSAVMSDEEKLWNCQELDQQCKDVLDLLSNNKRRWDHTAGDQGILPLEEYKKRTLAERKGDSNEPTRVTALHVLARLKQEFDAARKDVCEQLVRHLLENRVDSADESHSPEGNKRMLVLQVALIYENHKFILCVEECLRADFPDFLHLQDDAGRNCLHHLFAWPLERFGRAPLGRKSPGDNKLYLDQLNMLALKAEQRTLAAADKEGNTPIHYAMHAKQCYDRGDEYVNIVMILILRADEAMIKNNTVFNKNRESPVMYCRNILDAVKKEMKPNNKSKQAQVPVQATKAPNALSQMQSRGGQVDGSGPTKKSHKLVSHDAAAGTQYSSHGMENNINYPAMGSQGPTPKTPTTPTITATVPEGHRLQKAPTFGPSQDSALIQCQSQMLPPGKKREPPTTSAQAKDGRNAGDTKTASRDTASPAKTAISSMRAVQRLSNFLKMHYTGTRSDLSARDIIYGRGDDGTFLIEARVGSIIVRYGELPLT